MIREVDGVPPDRLSCHAMRLSTQLTFKCILLFVAVFALLFCSSQQQPLRFAFISIILRGDILLRSGSTPASGRIELTGQGSVCAIGGSCWQAVDRMRRCKGDIASGESFLSLQSDGNLCAYKGSGPADNQGVLWCNNTLQRCAAGTAQLRFVEPEGILVGSCDGSARPVPSFSVPLKAAQAGSYPASTTTPDGIVIHHGDLCPLAHALEKNLPGREVHLGVLGGSISCGHGLERGERGYPELFSAALAKGDGAAGGPPPLRPVLSNGARGATSTDLPAYCLWSMVPIMSRILIAEYSVNGARRAAFYAWRTRAQPRTRLPAYPPPSARRYSDMEAIVGQAGVGRRRALVVLNVNRDGSGSWEREASERLHVPVIELACALNSSTFAADNHHLNAHGHAVAASGLRALVRLAWRHRHACSGPSADSYGAQTDGATLAAADNKCTTGCVTAFDTHDAAGCFVPSRTPDPPWGTGALANWPQKRVWGTTREATKSDLGASIEFTLPAANVRRRVVAVGIVESNGLDRPERPGAPPLTHNAFSRRLGVASVWFVHATTGSTAHFAGNCTGHRTAQPPWTIQRLCELPLLASDRVSGVRVTLAGSATLSTGYNFAITGVYVRPSAG